MLLFVFLTSYVRKGGECGVERPGRVLPECYVQQHDTGATIAAQSLEQQNDRYTDHSKLVEMY